MTDQPFAELAAEQFCYLTTTGRTSGEPRTIEIWFGTRHSALDSVRTTPRPAAGHAAEPEAKRGPFRSS